MTKFSASLLVGIAAAVIASGAAQADVLISKQATANMSCSAGVCSPTAAKATLNATDLTNMLASGDVKVITGAGATNIVVKDSFSWTSTSRLTLDAIQSVAFDKPVTVAGTGAVTITTNDGGSGGDLLFGDKGNLTFWDLSSSLIVNGQSYTLVGDIKTLAADIAANPSGIYALANNYDASVDGTYPSAPINTAVAGTIEGLSHKVDGLAVDTTDYFAGFFAGINGGEVRDFQITNASVHASGGNGGLLIGAATDATIRGCVASGKLTVTSKDSFAGGLVGNGDGSIGRSHVNATISVVDGGQAGGLVGDSRFNISDSYSTGKVQAGNGALVGGLIGNGSGSVSQSYATGTVTVGDNSQAGGFIGQGDAAIDNSYATGAVKAGTSSNVGGFGGDVKGSLLHSYSIGFVKGRLSGGFLGVGESHQISGDYWDKDTSGRRSGCGTGIACNRGLRASPLRNSYRVCRTALMPASGVRRPPSTMAFRTCSQTRRRSESRAALALKRCIHHLSAENT